MLEKLLQASLLENAINAALSLDPQAAEKLATLNGRRVSVHLEHLPQAWVFGIDNAALRLQQDDEALEECDVRLRGNLGGFLQLFRQDKAPSHSANKLYIEGDLHAAQQFQRVMAELSPDFDAALRARFGDALGGAAASALQQLRAQGEFAKDKLELYFQQFMQGEYGFVGKEEFMTQQALLERLQARLKALEARLTAWETR